MVIEGVFYRMCVASLRLLQLPHRKDGDPVEDNFAPVLCCERDLGLLVRLSQNGASILRVGVRRLSIGDA